MTIPCCIFSYREDSYEVVLAARSASMAGLFPVFVVEDAAKPLSKEARHHLEEENAVVVTSDFPRPGNLRGIECINGMLQIYRKIFEKTGATHLVKLDSDTVLTSGDSLRSATGYDLFGWSSPKYSFHGSTYLISSNLTEEILAFIKRWQGIPGYNNVNCPEDLGIYRMAVLLHSKVGINAFDQAGGFGAFWQYQSPQDFFKIYFERFASISFGNRLDPDGNKVSKVESYMIMSSFMAHLSKWQSPTSSGSLLVA